jgi:hypothetical protein
METEIETLQKQIACMQKRLDNAKVFYNNVKAMRKAQRDYFSTRFQIHLTKSKELERQVDDEIDRVEGILHPQPTQQTLPL